MFNPTIPKYGMFNKMEKYLNKKNLIAFTTLLVLSFIGFIYLLNSSQNKNEKYFDIILAGIYNEEVDDQEKKIKFLSSLENPKISFFGDLELASIDNINKYEKIDKDLILIKRALLDLDRENLKNLSLDSNFVFSEVAEIFYLNQDLDNYNKINFEDNEKTYNFFLKAIDRHHNEVN